MSTQHPEPNPLNQPFPGAAATLKKHLLSRLEASFAPFLDGKKNGSAMSAFLRLHEKDLLNQAREVGGPVSSDMEKWVQHCSDYANGHGKFDSVASGLETLRSHLKS